MQWDKHNLKKYEESHIKWRIVFLLQWYIGFFYSTEYTNKKCNHSKAEKQNKKAAQTNTVQMQTNHLRKYHNIE